MAGEVTDEELRAYTAGYGAAMRYLEDLLTRWYESKEAHASCNCDDCRKLREIVQKNSLGKNVRGDNG